ncbi:MAG TPA: serine hydrolase domain-containing protein [Oleiagrimonas sp.]|nr:serine hydrolase domain-containing protein [Oleiagrimonas sp.]
MSPVAKCMLVATAMALGVGSASASTSASKHPDTATYDRLVDAVVARYDLPGIVVGVIDHGKVVYKRAIGKLPSGQPINADSLFEIGSNTKAMTVTLLARLVQQGKVQWDAPVTDYLPNFRMYDPWVTKNMEVGDLLAHHSGLPLGGGDLMLWPTPNHFTPEDVVHGLRYIKPAYSFRSGYAYDNTLYIVAGQVAATVGGAPYGKLLRREVFEPLGMKRCRIGTWSRSKVGNVARPHVMRNGKSILLPTHGDIVHPATMDAAGGVRCSLNAMLKWVKNWLMPTPDQLAWLSPELRRSEWQIYTPMPISERRHEWDGTLFLGNGHGWRISDVDGQMTVWHTGTLAGMYSSVMLLPFQDSGFVFMINTNAPDARTVLTEVLTKQFTAPDKARTVASYADELARAAAARPESHAPDTSARHSVSPAEMQAKLGVWRDPWFGKVRICPHDGKVRFASKMSPMLTGEVMRLGKRYMVHWAHGDADAWLKFPAGDDGILRMHKIDPNADFSYDYDDLHFTRLHGCQ